MGGTNSEMSTRTVLRRRVPSWKRGSAPTGANRARTASTDVRREVTGWRIHIGLLATAEPGPSPVRRLSAGSPRMLALREPRGGTVIRPTRPRRVALIAGILIGTSLGAVVAVPAAATIAPAFSSPPTIPTVLTGANITLTAKLPAVQILPGAKTRMWTYNETFPGPTIRRQTGQTTTVTLVNDLPAA